MFDKTHPTKHGATQTSVKTSKAVQKVENKLKLSSQRVIGSKSDAKISINKLQFAFESDRGRILNSAAVRRLQQKTQVFPLEKNSAVRSRLTHSLEVMQVGRFIAQNICSASEAEDCSEKTKQACVDYLISPALSRYLETVVEMSCILHDVGNPPFGHFGEFAISNWFKKNARKFYLNQVSDVSEQALRARLNEQELALFNDAEHFEGNAQAIRLVHSLMGLNLTYTQVAGILKYTRCGTESKPAKGQPFDYLKKKVGYYYSEQAYVQQLNVALDIQPSHRHPAAYIMEAADDISYCIADIEDAVEKNIMSIAALQSALETEYLNVLASFNSDQSMGDEASHSVTTHIDQHELAIAKYEDIPKRQKMAYLCARASSKAAKDSIRKDNAYLLELRVGMVIPLVAHASQRFLDNIKEVVDGSFNHALLEDQSPEHALSQTFKNVALKYAFSHKEVETRELQGYAIINGLLDAFSPLLSLEHASFNALCTTSDSDFQLESRLIKRIGNKHIATYLSAIKSIQHNAKQPHVSFQVEEYYYRCRLLQDHISGMTDQFALDEYAMFKVI